MAMQTAVRRRLFREIRHVPDEMDYSRKFARGTNRRERALRQEEKGIVILFVGRQA